MIDHITVQIYGRMGGKIDKSDKIDIVPGKADPYPGGGFYRSSLAYSKSYWPKATGPKLLRASHGWAFFRPTSTNLPYLTLYSTFYIQPTPVEILTLYTDFSYKPKKEKEKKRKKIHFNSQKLQYPSQ